MMMSDPKYYDSSGTAYVLGAHVTDLSELRACQARIAELEVELTKAQRTSFHSVKARKQLTAERDEARAEVERMKAEAMRWKGDCNAEIVRNADVLDEVERLSDGLAEIWHLAFPRLTAIGSDRVKKIMDICEELAPRITAAADTPPSDD